MLFCKIKVVRFFTRLPKTQSSKRTCFVSSIHNILHYNSCVRSRQHRKLSFLKPERGQQPSPILVQGQMSCMTFLSTIYVYAFTKEGRGIQLWCSKINTHCFMTVTGRGSLYVCAPGNYLAAWQLNKQHHTWQR